MSYISLYRKYRPKTFDEIVGQEVVVKILKNSIINNKIGHAYIFSGPRGTGKTSIAKIFSKAVNCLNNNNGDLCENCAVCNQNLEETMDIIEIDAASNNGIDEIREIRNNVKLMPSNLKYKVYIIDEVHMLSTSAFNALLKTLEEPPSFVIFILATTEFNKIPSTVISRCQKFDFKKIKKSNIISRLKYICKNENFEVNDDIISLIAELSDGGLRDSINMLDQIISINNKNITTDDVYNLIGEISDNNIFELLDSVVSGKVEDVIKLLDRYYDEGKNFINIANRLEIVIKNILIFNNSTHYFNEKYENILLKYNKIDLEKLLIVSKQLFELTNELKKSSNQKIITDIYFIKITIAFSSKKEIKTDNKKINFIENKNDINISENEINTEKTNDLIFNENNQNIEDKNDINSLNNLDNNTDISDDLILKEKNKNIIINNSLFEADKKLKNIFIEKFSKVNDYVIVKEYNSLASLLQKSQPEVVGEHNIIFTFKNNFEVVLFEKNTEEIIKFLELIYKTKYNIISITEEEWKKIKKDYILNIKSGVEYKYIEPVKLLKKSKKKTELQSSAENIFGDEFVSIQ